VTPKHPNHPIFYIWDAFHIFVVSVRSVLMTLSIADLQHAVTASGWSALYDVTELFDLYDTTFTELLDNHAPWHQIKPTARLTVPWFDAEYRVTKAKTTRLEKAYRQQRCAQSERVWRTQFSAQRALFQQKFVSYWSRAIDACHRDSKSSWSSWDRY